MSEIIRQLQDIPAVYKSEAKKYAELAVSILENTSSSSFVSESSTLTYVYTGGTQDLFNQLDIALADYTIHAVDWNLVRSFIYGGGVPISNNVKQKLVKVGGVLQEVQLLKADGVTLIAKTVLNRVGGILDSVVYSVYADNGVTELLKFKDTLVRVSGNLDNVLRVVL